MGRSTSLTEIKEGEYLVCPFIEFLIREQVSMPPSIHRCYKDRERSS